MVGLLHAMAFMVLLLIGWVIWNNKPLPLPLPLLWMWYIMYWSVMNGSVTNVVCYERSLLWTGLLWMGLLWTWSVLIGLLWMVCFERVCFERTPSKTAYQPSSSSSLHQHKLGLFFQPKCKIPAKLREKVCDAALDFIVHDIRPLHAIEGKGLQSLVSACIKIGAKCGNVTVDTILPSRLTVKRNLMTSANW